LLKDFSSVERGEAPFLGRRHVCSREKRYEKAFDSPSEMRLASFQRAIIFLPAQNGGKTRNSGS